MRKSKQASKNKRMAEKGQNFGDHLGISCKVQCKKLKPR